MKDDNWTDYTHPCFYALTGRLSPMTKEEYVAQLEEAGEFVEDCDAFDGDITTSDGCAYKMDGGTWDTCEYGRCSEHCNWLKKEE